MSRIRSRVHGFAKEYFACFYVQISMRIVSLISVSFTIYEAYLMTSNEYADNSWKHLNGMRDFVAGVEVLFFFLFFFDLLMNLFIAEFLSDYVLTWRFLVDFLSCLPVLTLFFERQIIFLFLRFFRIFKLQALVKHQTDYQVSKHESRQGSSVGIETNEATYFVCRLVINICGFVLLAAAAIFSLSLYIPYSYKGVAKYITFGESLYLAIVTCTTVGYGDIVPSSDAARALQCLIIVVAFSVIPTQLAVVASALLFRPKYGDEYRMSHFSKIEHIVLLGTVDYELLFGVCDEIFSKKRALPIYIVVLSPHAPSERVQLLLVHYKRRLRYYRGGTKTFADLARAKVHLALALYILPDVILTSLRTEEEHTFLTAISIVKYLDASLNRTCSTRAAMRRPRTLVKLTSSARNRPLLRALGVDVVMSLQELRYSLLGVGALFPGFVFLFVSLLGRAPESGGDDEDGHHSMMEIDLLLLRVPQQVLSHSFSTLVKETYDRSQGQVTLVGCKSRTGTILISPSGFPISEMTALILFTPQNMQVERVVAFVFSTNKSPVRPCRPTLSVENVFPLTRARTAARRIGAQQPASPEDAFTSDVEAQIEDEQANLRRLNSFVASVVRGVSSSHVGVREFHPEVHASKTSVKNHIVVLVAPSSVHELNVNALWLPLVYFLMAVRSDSTDEIYILSDRAEELSELAGDIKLLYSELLKAVCFVQGSIKSPDHLALCNVETARCVVILRPPVASEQNTESSSAMNMSSQVTTAADRHTIVASLNLHLLLQQHQLAHNSSPSQQPFVLAEVVHESNGIFLRYEQKVCASSQIEEDFPLLCSGGLLCHSIFDSLMVHAIFQKSLLFFWEAILQVGPNKILATSSSSSVASSLADLDGGVGNSSFDGGDEKEGEEKEQWSGKQRSDSIDESSKAFKIFTTKTRDTAAVPEQQASSAGEPIPRSILDKLALPSAFEGCTFETVFRALFEQHQAIAFGVYRPALACNSCSMPFVHVCPSKDLVLIEGDEVFVLLSQ